MKKVYFLLILGVLWVSFFGVTHAQTNNTCEEGKICLKNPLGNRTSATEIIGVLIRGAMGIMGSITLLMLVWGGFQWLTSAGNTEKVEKGTSTMVWAVVGVIIVLSSYILVSTLTNFLSTGTP